MPFEDYTIAEVESAEEHHEAVSTRSPLSPTSSVSSVATFSSNHSDFEEEEPVGFTGTNSAGFTARQRSGSWLSLEHRSTVENLYLWEEADLAEAMVGTRQLTHSLTRKSSAGDTEGQNTGEDALTGRRESVASVSSTMPPAARRRSTIVASIAQKTVKMGFWDEEFAHDRVDIVAKLGMNFLIICVCFILVLAVYWGSFYGKPSRYKNLEFLVAIDETEISGVAPLLSQTIQLVINSAAGREYGDWQVMNSTVLRSFADAHNNTVREEVDRLIHHQKYWGAIYVHANATYDYATAFRTSNTSFTPVNTLVEFVYESARDISISSYLKPIFSEIDAIYQAELYRSFFPAFFEVVGQKQLQSLLSDPALLTAVPAVNYRDNIPIPDYIFMAPLQIGLVYMIVFSFFQFLNFVKLHTWVSTRVFGIRYIIYRMTISHGSYVVVALAYAVLNVAFQIDYKQTFGKSGFLVLWAFAYLMMASLGGLNELVFLYILTFFPPLIGFWLLATIAINLAPTLNPIPLCSRFYQYGYAVPVWNAHQIMGVLFFNTWKGKLGREIGVLLAWTVITTAAVPFAMIHTSKIRARQEARAKERAAEEAISVK